MALGHVVVDGGVEVDPAEALDALGRAQDVPPGVGLAQHGGVEGAAAQVVDGDHGPGLDPGLRGVVDGGRLGLGHGDDVVEVGEAGGLAQQVELVGAPVGRVGDGDAVGRGALGLATWSTTQRSSRAIRASAEYGVPPTMIGVGSPSRRLNSRARPLGSVAARRAAGLADEHGAVVAQEHDRGDGRGPVAQAGDVVAAVAPHGGRRVRRADVDTQVVRRLVRCLPPPCPPRRPPPDAASPPVVIRALTWSRRS